LNSFLSSLSGLTLLSGLLSLSPLISGATPVSADPPPGYHLVWSDEFQQPVNAPPDSTHWSYETGANGWGNNEMEDYVTDMEHAHVVADPAATDGKALQIQATYNGQGLSHGNFQSARLVTRGKFSVQYGYIEARIQVPSGQGIWPAFWMLGANLGDPGVGWPNCGEVDIMEAIGNQPTRNLASLHGPGYSGSNSLHAPYFLPNGQQFKDGYHTFGLLWKPDSVTFSVDGIPYETRTPADISGKTWAFNHSFFLVMNLAVGGDFPGSPDATTVFPKKMLVDYVRVYQPSPTP
jgi:beta-glucanase (GH16 family)